MFSLRGNLLRTMLRVSHSALPLQRSITCGSRISPSSLPLFSVFVCVQSFSSLGNLGTGDYIVRWLSRISTIVCGECMEANLFYKFVREQTARRTMQRKKLIFCICNLNTFLPDFSKRINEKFLTLQQMNNLLIEHIKRTISRIKDVNEALISRFLALITEKANQQMFFF